MRRFIAAIIAVAIVSVAWSVVVRAQGEARYRAYLPVVRVDPTPTPVPSWWDTACTGKTKRELIVNGGFEDNEDGAPWRSLMTPNDYVNPLSYFRPGTVRAFVQRDIARSGRNAAAFPALQGNEAEGVYVNTAPFLRYEDDSRPGPHIGAARLRYWWYYQTDQPESFADDYVEDVLLSCRREGDGRVVVSNPSGYLEHLKIGRPQANRWQLREYDATDYMRYGNSGGWRHCLTIHWLSPDDDRPAAFYLDDVSLEVCE